ncbi:MAG: OB-fold domain-containing protein [Myxococcales bacterium]|nr:OB-fold domain-containing protein [Myxococcales bacterium]
MSHDVELVAPFALAYRYKRSTGPILGRFLTSLRDGRIEGVRCEDGLVLVPPGPADPRTGRATTDAWVELGPGGEVVAFTTTPEGSWGLVRLDGADVPLLHRLQVPAPSLRVGLRVRAVFAAERVGAITDLQGFEPEGTG